MKVFLLRIIALGLFIWVSPIVSGQNSVKGTLAQASKIPNVYQVSFKGLTGADRPLGAIVREGSESRVAYTSKENPQEDVLVEFTVLSDAEMSKKTGRELVHISSTILKKKNGDWVSVANPSIYTDISAKRPAAINLPGDISLSIEAQLIPTNQIPTACAALTGKRAEQFDLNNILTKLRSIPGQMGSVKGSAATQGVDPCCCCTASCPNGGSLFCCFAVLSFAAAKPLHVSRVAALHAVPHGNVVTSSEAIVGKKRSRWELD